MRTLGGEERMVSRLRSRREKATEEIQLVRFAP